MAAKVLRRAFYARHYTTHHGSGAIDIARNEACKFLTSVGREGVVSVTEYGHYVDEFEVTVWFWGAIPDKDKTTTFAETVHQLDHPVADAQLMNQPQPGHALPTTSQLLAANS